MEKGSETESSEILGDWDIFAPVNPEEIIKIVSVPTSPESEDARSNPPREIEIETRVSEKERGPTSIVGGEETARRVLPPWMDPSYEWGGGKWKEDGRKKKKKKKDKEKESEEIIPFKEVIEALLLNSGERVEEEKAQTQSCVDLLKSMGFNFPHQ